MNYLRIEGWEKWQTYRRDRGQPPWIKVHRRILRNPGWVSLTDAQRGQLVSIWLLAADHDGEIPADARTVALLCFMSETPDLELFMDKGFIVPDANVTPSRRQPDVTVTPQIRLETEAEAEAEADKTQCPVGTGRPPFAGIIAHLNTALKPMGRGRYRFTSKATQAKIRSRWAEGYRAEDFIAVIDDRVKLWGGDGNMIDYLRPETLFGQKFEGYLDAARAELPRPDVFDRPHSIASGNRRGLINVLQKLEGTDDEPQLENVLGPTRALSDDAQRVVRSGSPRRIPGPAVRPGPGDEWRGADDACTTPWCEVDAEAGGDSGGSDHDDPSEDPGNREAGGG